MTNDDITSIILVVDQLWRRTTDIQKNVQHSVLIELCTSCTIQNNKNRRRGLDGVWFWAGGEKQKLYVLTCKQCVWFVGWCMNLLLLPMLYKKLTATLLAIDVGEWHHTKYFIHFNNTTPTIFKMFLTYWLTLKTGIHLPINPLHVYFSI